MSTGILEDFATADDREKVLEQLIPGTEDEYYYRALHLQQTGRLTEVDDLLPRWRERHGRTGRYQEIADRQVLLAADERPDEARAHLRDRLGLAFDHQREVDRQAQRYPTRLDATLISRETLTKRALRLGRGLEWFTDGGLAWLLSEEGLSPERRRELLQRLDRPDHPSLVDRIAQDLDEPRSGGFGSHPIHGRLLTEQLDALAAARPRLWRDTAFVNTYLSRLAPGPDVDWEHDAAARVATLDRLWGVVSELAPSFNSLKVHVLYHRLEQDRAQGVVDRERLLAYLRLPREAVYVEPRVLRDLPRGHEVARLTADFRSVTGLPPVGDDEPLVRSLLEACFVDAESWEPFDRWVSDGVVRKIFATAKILAGVGDMEEWYSLLDDPAAYQRLKERVDIELVPSNRRSFRADEPVTLEVDVKNVSTLVVKRFQLNALNYFLAHGRDVDTSIDLDGLVANEEETFQFDEPPLRRVRRRFTLDSLSAPGLYVVELIGNGKSSRALIRKGSLRFLERISAAGHVFTVLDEDNRPLSDASLWLGGREFLQGEDGTIRVPFASSPGKKPIALCHGTLTTVTSFQHLAERYTFSAGFYVDRESLVVGSEACVLVRPRLSMGAVEVSLKLLREARLLVESTDAEDVSATMEMADLELVAGRETTVTFKVPEQLRRIRFTLKAKVRSATTGRDIELEDGHSLALNGIDATAHTAALYLRRTDSGTCLHLLGKSGEPRRRAPVTVWFQHRDFTRETAPLTLQTDDRGRIELGELPDITHLRAATSSGLEGQWPVEADRCTYPGVIHAQVGEVIRLPYLGRADRPTRDAFSLLERRGSGYLRDHLERLSLEAGFLTIRDLPAGDFELVLKESGDRVEIRLSGGVLIGGWIGTTGRLLERSGRYPLHIPEVRVDEAAIRVRLANATRHSRLHVFGTCFCGAETPFEALAGPGPREPSAVSVEVARSQYLSGRDIGDEYRYILERKRARNFPGNLLGRPGLLLNPWAIRHTDTGIERVEAGESFGVSDRKKARRARRRREAAAQKRSAQGDFASFDFLERSAQVVANLRPDDEGLVTIPREAVAGAARLGFLAVDRQAAVYRQVTLDGAPIETRDRRLSGGLDPSRHDIERKQVTPLRAGEVLAVADITTSRVEVYDTIAKAYTLYATLSGDATLETFAFVVRWPRLSREERRALYSEYACHELNLFLSRKDRAFFEAVVQPYLRNKRDKTFLDRYLLGHDLSDYLTPWAHGRLNVVERILLAQRVAGTGDDGVRHVGDLFEMLPPDVEGDNRRFLTALGGSALDAGGGFEMPPAPPPQTGMVGGGLGGAVPTMTMAGAMLEPEPMADEAPKLEEKAADWADEEEELEGSLDDLLEQEAGDLQARGTLRPLYRPLEATREWGENNYYHLPIEAQGPDRVTVNAFWRDFARHTGEGPFLSPHFPQASRNFTEMMLALSVLDLPFSAGTHEVRYEGAQMRLGAGSEAIVFHKEIQPAQVPERRTGLLVSQSYFRSDDRYRYEAGERFDKPVGEELLARVVYLCQVVVTNPTSTPQKLDLLLQVPHGAVPVADGFYTRSVHVRLQAFGTHAIEYAFYFPEAGEYPHYPVHASQNEALMGAAEPRWLRVVEALSETDPGSWAHVSQHGEVDEVLRFLEEHNVERLDLEKIAWRMRDRGFFERVLDHLARRHAYHHTLWSYSLFHDDRAHLGEYLKHCDDFMRGCGLWLESPLVSIDPVARGDYEHLEYAPLINARVGRLGSRHTILNEGLDAQYRRFLALLSYRPTRSPDDDLALAYYLLLQDRTEEGLMAFERVDRDAISTRVQYDYLDAYCAFFGDAPERARAIAERYEDYPVDRWRKLFLNVLAQLDEAFGKASTVVDTEDRTQQQSHLAASEPSFDFEVADGTVAVTYRNLDRCRVNYYVMDIELLFSRQPFVQQQGGQFAFIAPNHTTSVELSAGEGRHSFDIPERYRRSNLCIELVGAGQRKTQIHYAHELSVQLFQSYGQVQVAEPATRRGLKRVYVKVYARLASGRVVFHKDGYTDLRGRFDYASTSTEAPQPVARFALLILSEDRGAVIREVSPPAS